MWKEPIQDLGEIKARQKHQIVFEYEGDIKVKEIKPSCGCTNTDWNPENKTLRVTYTPASIPFHLKQMGKTSYPSKKSIVVNSEKSSDILTFTAEVSD